MSDTDSSETGTRADRGWKLLVGLGLVVVAGLIGWTLVAVMSTDGDVASSDASFVGYATDAGPEAVHSNATSNEAGDLARSPQDLRPPSGPRPRGAKTTTSTKTIIRQKLPDAGDAGDSGDVESADAHEWSDPGNQQMLGRPAWMATPSDEEAEAVEEALEEAARRQQKQRYPIALQERRLGVELAGDIVKDCFERLLQRAPEASGRVSVAFDLVANGSRARFENVEIPANVHLQDPQFEACITSEISAASFRSSEQGTMHVEYPFFFDGNDQR